MRPRWASSARSSLQKPRYHKKNWPYLANLAAAGFAPEAIDYVLCTHRTPITSVGTRGSSTAGGYRRSPTPANPAADHGEWSARKATVLVLSLSGPKPRHRRGRCGPPVKMKPKPYGGLVYDGFHNVLGPAIEIFFRLRGAVIKVIAFRLDRMP
jgi:hypothetical protein